MGEQHVKNIPRPIHAYRLTNEGAAPVAPATPRPAAVKRSRHLGIAAGVVAMVAVLTIGGAWLLHERTEPVPGPVQAAEAPTRGPAAATTTPAAPAPAPAPPQSAEPASAPAPPTAIVTPRIYVAADVPFVPDWRRRRLEFYGQAEGSKAMAINARGIYAFVTRRVDDTTARRIAMEDCNSIVRREVPVIREFDRCMTYAVGNDVIWSYRSPPLPPPPYLPAARPSPPIVFDAAAVPLIAENARKNLAEHYLKSDRKRALVLGRNHFEWWSPSDTEIDAVRRNLQTCGHITGRPCVVYAVDEQVVVRAPTRFRIVDIFTPQDLTNLDAAQQEVVERYLVADDWRAIAVARNGRLGIVVGRSNENAAISDAVRECARAGGTECAVSAVGPFLVTPK